MTIDKGVATKMEKKKLRIKNSYEPNRLAKMFLSDAYKKIIPQLKLSINQSKEKKRIIRKK